MIYSVPISNSVATLKFTFPLGYRLPKGKWISFSGNWYRNAHFYELNNAKKYYTEQLAEPQLKDIDPIEGPLYLFYVLYKPNLRKLDTDNFTTVHKKFFNDALTKYKIIPDDYSEIIPLQVSQYVEIDRENPRVDVYLTQDFEQLVALMRQYLCQAN